MRQRLYAGGVDGQVRIEEVGEADPVRLGDEPEQGAVAVERPGPLGGGYLQGGLLVPKDEAALRRSVAVLVDDLDGLVAVPLDADHFGEPLRRDPAHRGPGLYVFEACHAATQARKTCLATLALIPHLEELSGTVYSVFSMQGRSNFPEPCIAKRVKGWDA